MTDWNKFIEHGYVVIQPVYPISVLADSSVDVTFVAECPYDDETIPLDKDSNFLIEVYFGKNKINTIKFPFFLKEEDIPDDRLEWFAPKMKDY